MRILHVLNSSQGGASVGALELMRTSKLINSGMKHFVVYPGAYGEPDPMVLNVCEDCRVIPMSWWNKPAISNPLKRFLIKARTVQITHGGYRTQSLLSQLVREWKIDLIHTNTAAVDAGAILAARLKIPHVWHIRERIGEKGFMKFALPDNQLAFRIASLSDKIVPMSSFTGELFVNHGYRSKVQVVYDGVDLELFDSLDTMQKGRELRYSWGIPSDAIVIAKVASVTTKIKRHEVFIRAAGELAKRHPNIWFTLIGPLPKKGSWARNDILEYYASLRALVSELGIEKRFIWTGNQTDAGAIMNSFDILAHACDLEGFGRVAIEAMAAGKSVVGPDAGGFKESVIDSETGFLVPAGDHITLADALERLVQNISLRERFGEAGRKRVLDYFSPMQHLEQMRGIYDDVLHGSNSHEGISFSQKYERVI